MFVRRQSEPTISTVFIRGQKNPAAFNPASNARPLSDVGGCMRCEPVKMNEKPSMAPTRKISPSRILGAVVSKLFFIVFGFVGCGIFWTKSVAD